MNSKPGVEDRAKGRDLDSQSTKNPKQNRRYIIDIKATGINVIFFVYARLNSPYCLSFLPGRPAGSTTDLCCVMGKSGASDRLLMYMMYVNIVFRIDSLAFPHLIPMNPEAADK